MRMDRRIGLWGGQSKVPIGTEMVITESGTWEVLESGTYTVLCFGGGGGGGGGGGSASGTVNEVTMGTSGHAGGGGGSSMGRVSFVYLEKGMSIPVSIGIGGSGGAKGRTELNRPSGSPSAGSNGVSGGDTSFGTYSSVPGGGYGGGATRNSNGSGGKKGGNGTSGSSGSGGGEAFDETQGGSTNMAKGGSGGKNSGYTYGNGGNGGHGGYFREDGYAYSAGAGAQGKDGAVILTLLSYEEIPYHRVIFENSTDNKGAYCNHNGVTYESNSDFYAIQGDEITVGVPKYDGNQTNVYGVVKVNGVTVLPQALTPVSYTMSVPSDVYISVSKSWSDSIGPGGRSDVFTINIRTADVNPWYTVDVSGVSPMGLYVSYNGKTYTEDGTMIVSCNDTLTIKRGYYMYGTCSVILNGETVATIGNNSSYSWTVTSNASIVVSGNTVTITTK